MKVLILQVMSVRYKLINLIEEVTASQIHQIDAVYKLDELDQVASTSQKSF
jgi:UDP-glucose 4-epimerase